MDYITLHGSAFRKGNYKAVISTIAEAMAEKYQGSESKARNQRMQNMFRMIGYGENLGSGFPLILNAWNEKHWIRPELVEQPELMQVKLTLYFENAPVNAPVKLTDR